MLYVGESGSAGSIREVVLGVERPRSMFTGKSTREGEFYRREYEGCGL